jgi:hypothetical protein
MPGVTQKLEIVRAPQGNESHFIDFLSKNVFSKTIQVLKHEKHLDREFP